MPEPRATFLAAAEAYADLVDRLPADLGGPGAPGLGEWDLRALVGHTSRSLVTVSAYLAQPAATRDVESAADYYRAIRHLTSGPGVDERGRQAGKALGADPSAAVRRLLATVVADLDAATDDQLLTTLAGGMRLRDYLPTRTFELVVHGTDIAAATALAWEPPAHALTEALGLAADVALLGGDGVAALRALTGRPGAISVV